MRTAPRGNSLFSFKEILPQWLDSRTREEAEWALAEIPGESVLGQLGPSGGVSPAPTAAGWGSRLSARHGVEPG